jgi:hypothetical protein
VEGLLEGVLEGQLEEQLEEQQELLRHSNPDHHKFHLGDKIEASRVVHLETQQQDDHQQSDGSKSCLGSHMRFHSVLNLGGKQ